MTYRYKDPNQAPLHNAEANQAKFDPYAVIYKSELQYMADLAAEQGEIETGGELYGLLSHGGRVVIMLVTGPGPDAIHQKTNFQQDIEFLKRTNEFLVKNYGIQYLGPWHSHHLLGLREPSFVDIQSTRSTAKKNAYKKLSQFIITFEKWPQHASVFQRSQTRSWKRKAKKKMVIQQAKKVRTCRWKQ